jgi:hypothetical protein
MGQAGYGDGYLYPHDFPFAVVDQSYFPAGMEGTKFYFPKDVGFEREIKKRVEWREARRKELRRGGAPPPPGHDIASPHGGVHTPPGQEKGGTTPEGQT